MNVNVILDGCKVATLITTIPRPELHTVSAEYDVVDVDNIFLQRYLRVLHVDFDDALRQNSQCVDGCLDVGLHSVVACMLSNYLLELHADLLHLPKLFQVGVDFDNHVDACAVLDNYVLVVERGVHYPFAYETSQEVQARLITF